MSRINRIVLSLFLFVLVAVCAPFHAFAQALPYSQSSYYAINYGNWSIQSQSANTYQFYPVSQCQVPQVGGSLFNPFATNAPVYIADSNSALSEVVTPSAIIASSAYCGVVISPVNSHISFNLRSGTAGLQEALNVLALPSTAYPAKILLDRNWFTAANAVPPAATTALTIIAAVKGNAHAFLEDITSAASVFYVWNGSSYVTGTWSNVKPTVAAGAAAGTSPTISNLDSTALIDAVTLTEGTSPTTGVLFTLTWATSSQFLYAPTCTVSSTGTNSFTAFTSATTYTASHAVLTVTATSAPTASTAYAFQAVCY